MSILNLSSLRKIFNASSKKGSKKSITEKMNRKLAVDSLEARVLMTVTPNNTAEILVNTEYSTNQTTYTNGNAVAMDDDGDYVVTWTRGDNIYKDTTYGNVGWYNQEGELVFFTDRNFIDGNYTDDLGVTHDIELTPYEDPYANVTPITYYVDQNGERGWTDDYGYHEYTAEHFAYSKYTVYVYEVDDIPHRDLVVYREGDALLYTVKTGQYITKGEKTADGKRDVITLVSLQKKTETPAAGQLVDYNVYGRYFTDEVQRLTIDTSSLAKSTGRNDGEMLYKAEIQIGDWYEQKITFSTSYGNQLPFTTSYKITYQYPTEFEDAYGEMTNSKSVNFDFAELNELGVDNALVNAKTMQEALEEIFGVGNVEVTPETTLEYTVKYKIDEMAEGTTIADYNSAFQVECNVTSMHFCADVELVSMPNSYEFYIEYVKVYDSQGKWTGEYEKELDDNGKWTGRYVVDVAATAEAITVAFELGKDCSSREITPVSETTSPTTGVISDMYQNYEVNTVPVYGLDKNNDLIGFDITFVNTSGKQDIQTIKVNRIYTISEEFYTEEEADNITDELRLKDGLAEIYNREIAKIEKIQKFYEEVTADLETQKEQIEIVKQLEEDYEETVDNIIAAEEYEAKVDTINNVRELEERIEIISDVEEEIGKLDDELEIISEIQILEEQVNLITEINIFEQEANAAKDEFNSFKTDALANISAFEEAGSELAGITNWEKVSGDENKTIYKSGDNYYKTEYKDTSILYEDRGSSFTYLNNIPANTKVYNYTKDNQNISYIYYTQSKIQVYTDNNLNAKITIDNTKNTSTYENIGNNTSFIYRPDATIYTDLTYNISFTETNTEKVYNVANPEFTVTITGTTDNRVYSSKDFTLNVTVAGNAETYQVAGTQISLTVTDKGTADEFKVYNDLATGTIVEVEKSGETTKTYTDRTDTENILTVTASTDNSNKIYTLEDQTITLTLDRNWGTGNFVDTDPEREANIYITEQIAGNGNVARSFQDLNDNVTISTVDVAEGEPKVYTVKNRDITFTVNDTDSVYEYKAENDEDSVKITIQELDETTKSYAFDGGDTIIVAENGNETIYTDEVNLVQLVVNNEDQSKIYNDNAHGVSFNITTNGNAKTYTDNSTGYQFVVTKDAKYSYYRIGNVVISLKNGTTNKIYTQNGISIRITKGEPVTYDFFDGTKLLHTIIVTGEGEDALYTVREGSRQITIVDEKNAIYEEIEEDEFMVTITDRVLIEEISEGILQFTDELADGEEQNVVVTMDLENDVTTYEDTENNITVEDNGQTGIRIYTIDNIEADAKITVDTNAQSITFEDYDNDREFVMNEYNGDKTIDQVITLKECSSEFRINPTSDEVFNRKSKIFRNTDQYESAVAMDDNGDYAFSWTSETLQTYIKGSFTDIYAKLYSASMVNAYDAATQTYVQLNDGKAYKEKTAAMKINTETANPQQSSSITMDDKGNAFVVWASTAQTLSFKNGIYMSCLDADGNKVDLKYLGITNGLSADGLAVRVDAEPTGHAVMPQVAVSPDGETIAVSWNWVDPTNTANSEIRLSVFHYTKDANNKTILQKTVDSYVIDTVEGLDLGDSSAYDGKHSPTGIYYSYDNNTSIQINQAGQLGIAWTGVGTDAVGLATVDTYFSQYQLTNGTLQQVRTKYRINSASMDSTTTTTWSWNHKNPTVAMDADGDFLVSYDGAGKDASEAVSIDDTIIALIQEKINEGLNADLLPYVNWYYMQREHIYSSVDTAIQDICARALQGQFTDPDATYMMDPEEIWYSWYDDTGNTRIYSNKSFASDADVTATGVKWAYYENGGTYRILTAAGEVIEGYLAAKYTDTNNEHVDYNYAEAVEVTSETIFLYDKFVYVVQNGEIKQMQLVSMPGDVKSVSYSEKDYWLDPDTDISYLTKNGGIVYSYVWDAEAYKIVRLPRLAKYTETTTTDEQTKKVTVTRVYQAFVDENPDVEGVTQVISTINDEPIYGYKDATGQTVTYKVLENGHATDLVRVAKPTDSDKNLGFDYSQKVMIYQAELPSGKIETYLNMRNIPANATLIASTWGYLDADGNVATVLVVNSHGEYEELPLVAQQSDVFYRPNYNYTTDELYYMQTVDGEELYGYKDGEGNYIQISILDAATNTIVTGRRIAAATDDGEDYNYNFSQAVPLYTGCTIEQAARLEAILHSVLDLTKGEINGVHYTSFDASPISASPNTVATTPTILSSDVIVNTVRDGEDAKFYITLNRTSFFDYIDGGNLNYASKYYTDENGNYILDANGWMIAKPAVNTYDFQEYSYDETINRSLTIQLYWNDFGGMAVGDVYGTLDTNLEAQAMNPITVTVDLTSAYYDAVTGWHSYINAATAATLIENALQTQLTNLWPEPAYSGCVKVTPVSLDSARMLDGTDYDLNGVFTLTSADELYFEIQFQGELHDAPITIESNQSVVSTYNNAPSFIFDFNQVTGRYCRFLINHCDYDGTTATITAADPADTEEIIVDLGYYWNEDGTRDMDAIYSRLRAALSTALINAGYGPYGTQNPLFDIQMVDMVCDNEGNGYVYGQTYQVMSVRFKGVLAGYAVGITIDTSNPYAGGNNNNNNNTNAELAANYAKNVISGERITRTGSNASGAYMAGVTTFSEGDMGTAQAFSCVGITPEGDYGFIWTQYNEDTWGTVQSQSIYTRTYNEIYDTYGPRVSDVYYSNSTGLQKINESSTVNDLSQSEETRALIITFTEDMMDHLKITSAVDDRIKDENKTHSVSNADNWVLMKDGLIIDNAIKEVYFGMNASADPYIQNIGTITALAENKWEAVIILNDDIDLSTGNYQLQLSKVVWDSDGIALNSDGVDTDGSNFDVNFDILTGAQDPENETPEEETEGDQVFVDLDNTSDIWSPTTLASDPEGDTVIVWNSLEKGEEGVYAKVKYLKWDEAINKNNREDDALNEGSIVVKVTDDASASYASVDMGGDGNFVVTWTADANDGYRGTYVYARVFDLNGNAITDAFVVSQSEATSKWSQVAVSEAGDFVITWQTYDKTTGWDIYAQRFGNDGTILGAVDEVQVLTFSRDFSGSFQIRVTDPNTYKMYTTETIEFKKTYTTSTDILEALEALEIPGLTYSVTAKSRTQIYVTIICDNTIVNPNVELLDILPSADSKGSTMVTKSVDGSRSPFMVNKTTEGNQTYASIGMDYEGNFVVSWTSSSPDSTDAWDTDIYARQFISNKSLGYLDSTIKTTVIEETETTTSTINDSSERITWMDDEEEPISTQSGVAHITVISDPTTGMGWTGSGVLLSDGNCCYVLTAQHCVNSNGTVANSRNTTIEFYNTSGTKVTAYVSEVYLFDGYNPSNQVGDIALIKLTESLSGSVTGFGINRELGAEQGAIYTRYGFGTYGTGSEGNVNNVDGTMHTGQNRWEYISDDGFLLFDFDDGTTENNNLPYYIKQLYGDTITSDLGIGATETNSCGGDSGGPCFIDVNGESVIAGICAGGYSTDCKYGDVSYDTQVAFYADWIDSIIGVSDGAVSDEILVNTTRAGSQKWSDVDLDADGDFVITWTSSVTESATETDVYARRFSKDGVAVTNEDFKVNTFTERQQQLSKVAMDADGDFTIVWESFQEYGNGTSVGDANNYGIYMQRYASTAEATLNASIYGPNGESGTEMRVNTTMFGNQRVPSVATTATGDLFFAWQSDENVVSRWEGSEDIYTRAIYKSDDDAGPAIVRIEGEFTPTIIGINGELINSDRNPILDDDGNLIYVNFLIENGNTFLQNSDYYFIDRYGNLVNEAITVTKNGYIVGTSVKVDNLFLENGKLYIQSGVDYYDLNGNKLAGKQAADTLLQNGKLVKTDGTVTNIDAKVVIQDGEVFIMTETARKYYDAEGNVTTSGKPVDRLMDESHYLLDADGKQVLVDETPIMVSECWVSDGKVFLKNAEGYYITRDGQTSTNKVAAETYTSDGKLLINGKASDITATVRCEDGNIYFEYIVNEMLDHDGNVMDRIGVDSLVNISNLSDSATIYGKINDGLYITFDEQLWGQKDDMDEGGSVNERRTNSILNKSNFIIRLNGSNVTADIIDHIELANDSRRIGYDNVDSSYTESVDNHSEKDIYKIVFKDGVSLESGSYQLLIYDNVEDRFGNQLDGNYDGTPGGNFQLDFNVIADLDDEASVNSDIGDSDEDGKESDNEVNTLSVASQSDPVVAMNKWGDYVIVWVSEVPVTVTDSDDDNTTDTETRVKSDQTVIMGQRYLRDGTKVGDTFCISDYTYTTVKDGVVNTQTLHLSGIQTCPAVAMDDEGNFAVSWTVNGRDLNEDAIVSADEMVEYDVYVRTYNTDGEATSVPFLVDDSSEIFLKSGNKGCTKLPDYSIEGAQKDSAIAYSRTDNTFVVTWTVDGSKNASYGTYWQEDYDGIYMARFKVGDKEENPSDENQTSYLPIYRQETPQLVNIADTYTQGHSTVAVDAEENIIVAWESDSVNNTDLDIYLKKFEVTDTSDTGKYISGYTSFNGDLGEQTLVNQNTHLRQTSPDIAMNDEGDFVIAWASKENEYDIKFRTYNYVGNGMGSWTDEQRANTVTTFDQEAPTVAITRNVTTKSRKEPNTSFAISWTSYGQEKQSTYDLGVFMIAYKSITDVDPQTNQIRGDNNIRTKSGKEVLVNAYKPQNEKNPDIAMSWYGDIVTVWEGPSIASITDPVNNIDECKKLLAAFYNGSALDTDEYDDMTKAEIIRLFNNTFGTSIFKSYQSSYDSNANMTQILLEDDYVPLQDATNIGSFTGTITAVSKAEGPSVSVDNGNTTVYSEKNTDSTVVINLAYGKPSMTINGTTIDLTDTESYVFNGYYAGNAAVNVEINGAGNEEVSIENGILCVKTGNYSFIVKNMDSVTFDSQNVILAVNARKGDTFTISGDVACLSGAVSFFTISGCSTITAIGNASAVAKLTGTEDEEEFQVKANEVTMSGKVSASVSGFGKISVDGDTQDEVFFTNIGDFTVNESVISVTGVEASNFAKVNVASTGVANVITSGKAVVNVSGKTLTITGEGFTQTCTGMSTLNLSGTVNASAEVQTSSNVTFSDGKLAVAKYSVNSFGQIVVTNASKVTLTGTEGDDTLTIDAASATFESADSTVTFNSFSTLTLNDSEGNDAVSVLSETDKASINVQNGVAKINKNIVLNGVSTLAITCANANASVNLLGSAGDDLFTLSEGTVSATIEGASYTVTGASTIVVCGMGGNDQLTATDTTGDDAFTIAPSSLTAKGSDDSYSWTVSSVKNITLYQSNGGNDSLNVNGSYYVDYAVVSPKFISVTNANKATVSAYGFGKTQVSNVEYITMYDSEGDDALTIAADGKVTLESGSSFFNQVSGFKKLSVFSCGDGEDTLNAAADVQAVDEIFSASDNSWSVELNGFDF